MKEYTKLDAIAPEDLEKIREYAEAMNELFVVKNRERYLRALLEDSEELRESIWTTQEGVSKAIADLEDDHLKNIIPYMNRQGVNNARIRREYQKRFGVTPELDAPQVIDEFDDY